MRKSVTVKDVAAAAAASVGTVSRVFNGFKVEPAIAAKVREAAAALGYQPRSAKREASSSLTFAILAHDRLSQANIWTQQMVYSVFNTLSQYGHRAVLEFLPSDGDAVPAVVRGVAGCMVWGEFPDRFYANLAKATGGLPVVSYSRPAPYENSVAVVVDNQRSMSQAVGYLLASKHRDIAYMTWSRSFDMSVERQTGFRTTMAEFGQDVDEDRIFQIYERHPDWEGGRPGSVIGYEATSEILDLSPRPTAIIYDADMLAWGGMEAIKRRGLRVPGDVSVLGFDDLVGSDETFPPLTTMRLDTSAVATAVVESLEKLLARKPHEPVVRLSRELVKRKSVEVLGT